MPILRPLIGMDKLEITAEARRLGTFEISIEPDADCCTLFVPKHPATRMSEDEIARGRVAAGDPAAGGRRAATALSARRSAFPAGRRAVEQSAPDAPQLCLWCLDTPEPYRYGDRRMTVVALGADHAGLPLKEVVKSGSSPRGVDVLDFGTHTGRSVDYPDFAVAVGGAVRRHGRAWRVWCAARASAWRSRRTRSRVSAPPRASTSTPPGLAREHNDTNVLALGARITAREDAVAIVRDLARAPSSPAGVTLAGSTSSPSTTRGTEHRGDARLADVDPEVAKVLREEAQRQHRNLELIASENFVSEAVLEAVGSVLTNKYAEGYPGRRYYGGCEVVDVVEDLAIARARELFGAEHVNVQPHSGAQANMAVYFTLLKPGDVVLGPNLSHGGHLTAGSPVNYSGQALLDRAPTGCAQDTERIDLDEVRDLARQHRPKLIIAGGSAFPAAIDFAPFAEIAREVERGA